MRFTFEGTYGGRHVAGEWTPGRLDGDPELAHDAGVLVRRRADVSVPGFGGGLATLALPIPAMGVLLWLMPDCTFPEVEAGLDDLPPSAVA